MSPVKPISLGRAWDLIDRLVAEIAAVCPALEALEPAGDVRRVEALVSSVVRSRARAHRPRDGDVGAGLEPDSRPHHRALGRAARRHVTQHAGRYSGRAP